MGFAEKRVIYFEEPGSKNTLATLRAAKERAKELRIQNIVIASSHGKTAIEALKFFAGEEIVVATICESFRDEGWTMSSDERSELASKGVRILTCPHILGDGISSSVTEKYGGRGIEEIIRDTLYRFCQGMKVCVEITLMAADSGLIDVEKEVIAIAGTNGGADTAVVLKPAFSRKFYDLRILEVIAKPR